MKAPSEPLWQLRVNRSTWTCELRTLHTGEWEARVFCAGDLAHSRRFMLRPDALLWASEMRQQAERGREVATEGNRDGRQVERLWQVRARNSWWSCEMRFLGESYGWEARIFRDGDRAFSHRHLMRADAGRWATETRRDIEEGPQE